ncbi:hypothetical protein [uncultured Eudoraea sp.]|nr:hypothetical protein [uncultured Eudoraea sp.]
MNNYIFYILAGVALVYIILSIFSKKVSKRRKSRKFMDGYERKDEKE